MYKPNRNSKLKSANRLEIAKRIFTEQIAAEKFIFLQIHSKKLKKYIEIIIQYIVAIVVVTQLSAVEPHVAKCLANSNNNKNYKCLLLALFALLHARVGCDMR